LWDRAGSLPEPTRTAVLDRLRALAPPDSAEERRAQSRPSSAEVGREERP
jgi:hypothetical protein